MLRWFLALTVAAVSLGTATASFTISSVPSMGPVQNAPGATAPTYYANALAGLQSGGPAGVVATPSYYQPAGTMLNGGAITSISPADVAAAGGGLWNGAGNQTGAFAGQVGNAIYMGLAFKATTTGERVTPSQVSYNGPLFAGLITPSSTTLATYLSGTLPVYGKDNVGDPTVRPLTPADATNLFAELYYVGEAFTFNYPQVQDWPGANIPLLQSYSTVDGGVSPTNGYYNTPNAFYTGTWSVAGAVTGSSVGITEINGAPAPATFVMMGLGFVGSSLLVRVRRRRA